MNIKYSVIIPALNEEMIIENLLIDLKNQTIKPFEVIVADKSTDSTPEIAKKYGARIVEGVNDYYIGRARNNAARVASTDFLFFFDADNRLPDSHYIENFMNQFLVEKLDLAHSKLIPNNNTFFNSIIYTFYNLLRSISAKSKIITSDVGSGLMMKKSVFDELGGYREDLKNNEDIDLLHRAMKKKYKYRILKTKLTTSDRRIKNRGFFGLILLLFSATVITILVRIGYNSENPLVKRLEKIYWNK